MATEFGTAVCRKNYETGEVTVMEADDVIGVTPELWDDCRPEHRPDDETFVLDTAGEYRYRLTGGATDNGRIFLIFKRIREASDGN
jgi:hypothetical protein